MNKGTGNVFKPAKSQHKLHILSEPTETVFKKEDGTETPQIKLEVKVDGNTEQSLWYVSKGTTTRSVFGQLILIGKNKGQLKGETVTLLTKKAQNKDGTQRNDYTVLEALPYMDEPTTEKVE